MTHLKSDMISSFIYYKLPYCGRVTIPQLLSLVLHW